jgi:hypothetical protein
MTRHRVGCGVLLALVATSTTWSWGGDGHKLIGRLAARNLPADMPAFFTAAEPHLAFLNPEPDAWRDGEEQKSSTALSLGHDPDHIFKFELYAPDVLPPDRYTFIETLTQQGKSPRPVGMLPYRAMELFQRMRVSWRRWRTAADPHTRASLEARIVDDAGILGHYIADSAQPLHMSVNRNGWELADNPRGYTRDNTLHRRFESEFVNAHVTERHVQPLVRPVKVADDGLKEIYAHMRRSWDHVNELYELELQQPFGPAQARPEAVGFAASRLADAVSTLRDLWYTAYVTSAARATAP